MARKVVRTISVTGVTLAVYSATPLVGASVEVDTLGAFGDSTFTNVGRTLKQYAEVTVTCLDEGAAIATKAGDVTNVTLSVSFGDGGAVGSDTVRTATRKMNIVSVEAGGDVAVDGDRKATVVFKMIPVGGD